jgi:lysophospholipase L1-like esterase
MAARVHLWLPQGGARAPAGRTTPRMRLPGACLGAALLAGTFAVQAADSAPGDLAEAGGYVALSAAAANLGGGTRSRHFLNHYRSTLIRQDGRVEKVSLYLAAKPAAVTAFYIAVWRKAGTTWNCISQEDIWPRMTGGRINEVTLSAPPLAQEGDYVGYGYACTGAPGLFLTATTDPDLYDPTHLYANQSYSVTDAECAGAGFDWAAQAPAPQFVPVKVYMQRPRLVFTGDSIISGAPAHLSFADNYFPEAYGRTPVGIRPETTIGYQVGKALGWSYQNLGIAGATSDWLLKHGVFDRVLEIRPHTVVISVGINDLASGVSQAAFLANYATMLEACQSRHIGVLVNLIMPRTDFSNAKAHEMDEWNAALRALAESHGAGVADARAQVGCGRAGGDPGNSWDLRPEYAADIVHLKPEGHAVVAQVIVAALRQMTSTEGR